MARMLKFIFFIFFMFTGIFLLMLEQVTSLTDAAIVISILLGSLHVFLSLIVLFFVKFNPLKGEIDDGNEDNM